MTEQEEKKSDERWCENGEGRYGEYGVIGAEQADESYYDDRFREEDGNDDDDFGADGRIHFASDKLYGREEELDKCKELFDSNQPSAVFVSGFSGSGKSRVVEEFIRRHRTITDKKPSIIFLRSKSEAMQASVPFSSISGLFDNIDKSVSAEFIQMRHEIQDTLGHDAKLLLKVFPRLENYLGEGAESRGSIDTSSRNSDSMSLSGASTAAGLSATKQDTKKRMMFALQFFFRTLSLRSKRRLCIFLDDLQRIDLESMELIESILTDSSIKNLFFFGGYRSNEVDKDHILMKTIQAIKEKRQEKEIEGCLRIELKDLDKDAIGQFIADSLRLRFEETLPLTNAVFTKSLGNPFFTRQALEFLVLKNALYYDTICFRWDWKLQENELKDLISDDLLQLVKVKIEHMEPKLQQVLMTASCTRSTFDIDTMLVLLHPQFLERRDTNQQEYEEKKNQLIGLLNQGVIEGLLIQPHAAKKTSNLRYSIQPSKSGDATGDEYAFAHDKIQETARSLINSAGNELEMLEQIGSILARRAEDPVYGEDWMYFTACEHLNRVSEHYKKHFKKLPSYKKQEEKRPEIMDKEKEFQLAALNLRTAELSLDLFAFPATIDFCKHGISYLPAGENERWSDKYRDVTLHLYSIAAQAQYGAADVDAAERYCNLVMISKVSMIEAIPVLLIYLDIVGDKGEKQAGLELCMNILKELGVSAPKSERMLRAKVWWSLKKVKSRYLPTEETIQSMPHMADPLVAQKMELMRKGSSLAYAAEQRHLYMLLNCESVKEISRNGLTESSAASMASFANVLMHAYGDFETSPKLAELAILLADRQQSKFSETQPLNTSNYNVLGWVRPLTSCSKYHERAYKSGIASGNLNGAAVGKWFGFQNKLFSSCMTLPELEGEFRGDVAEMWRNGQHFVAGMATVAWQLILNIIGKSGNVNTTVLSGEATDEYFNELSQLKMPPGILYGPWQSMAFLIFGDFEAGAEDALKRGDEFPNMAPGMMFGFECIMRAIPLLIMARSDNPQKGKYRAAGMKLLKRVRRWVKKGCVNMVGLHQLMEAEYMAIRKNKSSARAYFEMAIASCRKDHFHQLAGLSCELYAGYLSEIGDSEGEKTYLHSAIGNYRRSGSARKVGILKKKLED